jgi:hypothetical protein
VHINADNRARAGDELDLRMARNELVEGWRAVLEDDAVAPQADYLGRALGWVWV